MLIGAVLIPIRLSAAEAGFLAGHTEARATSLAELKKLLARFPRGTTFGFRSGSLDDPAAEDRVFHQLKEHLAPHRLKMVETPDAR